MKKERILLIGVLSVLAASCVRSEFEITDLSPERHDEYFEEGVARIRPYMVLHGQRSRRPDRREIKEGIAYLDAVTRISPENWSAFWIKGKGYQALGDSKSAYVELKNAFNLNMGNADVARELVIECLNLGRGAEGVEVAQHAVSLERRNAGLIANLGLAYLINGELDEAEKTTQEAIDLAPNDDICRRLLNIIKEVQDGKRAQPKRYSDL
jgi:Flp pilus assembly protein TadD